jgi:hypothetical protein
MTTPMLDLQLKLCSTIIFTAGRQKHKTAAADDQIVCAHN